MPLILIYSHDRRDDLRWRKCASLKRKSSLRDSEYGPHTDPGTEVPGYSHCVPDGTQLGGSLTRPHTILSMWWSFETVSPDATLEGAVGPPAPTSHPITVGGA